jgi:hypothetical protein
MSMATVAFVGRVQAGVSSSGRIHGQRRNSNVPWLCYSCRPSLALTGRESMAVTSLRPLVQYERHGFPAALPEACVAACLSVQTSDLESLLPLTSCRLLRCLQQKETKGDGRGDEVMEMMPTHASVHPLLSLRGCTTAVRAEPSIAGAWHLSWRVCVSTPVLSF